MQIGNKKAFRIAGFKKLSKAEILKEALAVGRIWELLNIGQTIMAQYASLLVKESVRRFST